MKRSRILFVTHVGDPGGAEQLMLQFCQKLPHDCEVLLLQRGLLESMLEAAGISCTVRQMSSSLGSIRRDSGARSSLWAALRGAIGAARDISRAARSFDLVVCVSQKAFALTALGCLTSRKPLVWLMNDILTTDHFSRSLIRMAVCLGRRADLVVVNSEASKQAWISAGGEACKVRVLYPGIELRGPQSTEPNPWLVGMFGRITEWKGQHVFIEAMARVPEARAIVVGGSLFGHEAYETRIRDLAAELRIVDRIEFVGHVGNVRERMGECAIVVHCSTAPEPFGLVIVEAMDAGAAVIASDAGGAREIVTQGLNGLLVPAGDVQAFADAIRRCLTDPALRSTLVSNARSDVARRFSGQAMVAGLTAIIQPLLRGRGDDRGN